METRRRRRNADAITLGSTNEVPHHYQTQKQTRVDDLRTYKLPEETFSSNQQSVDEREGQEAGQQRSPKVYELLFSSVNLVGELANLGIQSVFLAAMKPSVFISASSIGHDFINQTNLKESFKNYCESPKDAKPEHFPSFTNDANSADVEGEMHTNDDAGDYNEGVDDGNDQTLDDGNDQTVDDGNDQTVDDGNDQTVDDGNDQTVDDGNDQTVDDGNDQTVDDGNDQTMDIEKTTVDTNMATPTQPMTTTRSSLRIREWSKSSQRRKSNIVEVPGTKLNEIKLETNIDAKAVTILNSNDANLNDANSSHIESTTLDDLAGPGTQQEVVATGQEETKRPTVKKEGSSGPSNPSLTCSNCNRRFAHHYLFNGVLYNGEIRESYVCDECGRQFKEFKTFIWHNTYYHPDLKPYSCCYCPKQYAYSRQMRSHMIQFHPAVKPYKCDKCEKSFVSPYSLRQHLGKHVDLEKDGIECDGCGKKFGNHLQLRLHNSRFECGRKYVCCECRQVFGRSEPLKAHLKTHAVGIDEFVCKECDTSFRTYESFSNHVTISHEPWQAWFCTMCKEKFPLESAFLKHRCKSEVTDSVRPPPQKKQFCCDTCGEMFTSVHCWKKHLISHMSSKDYRCMECGRSFFTEAALKSHVYNHHSQLSFSCKVCGKEFNSRQRWYHHARELHSDAGKRQYQCTVCGKMVRDIDKLRHHMMIHTGEKPYSCSVCGKQFRSGSDVRKHLMIHTGEKKYACELCGKRYNNLKSLRIHRESPAHDNIRRYACEYCQASFSTEQYMKLHMKKKICIFGKSDIDVVDNFENHDENTTELVTMSEMTDTNLIYTKK